MNAFLRMYRILLLLLMMILIIVVYILVEKGTIKTGWKKLIIYMSNDSCSKTLPHGFNFNIHYSEMTEHPNLSNKITFTPLPYPLTKLVNGGKLSFR